MGVTVKPRVGIGWVLLDGEKVIGHAGSFPSVLELAAIVVAEKLSSEEECDVENKKSEPPANAG